MAKFSLDELRETIKKTQEEGNVQPNNPAQQVVVGSDGNIKMGDQLKPGEIVTEVQQDIFAERHKNG
jgi:hypothetical protein